MRLRDRKYCIPDSARHLAQHLSAHLSPTVTGHHPVQQFTSSEETFNSFLSFNIKAVIAD